MRIAVRLGQLFTIALLAVTSVYLYRGYRDAEPQARPAAQNLPSGTVVGPFGLGKLKLGMSARQAMDTGDVSGVKVDTSRVGCTVVPLPGGGSAQFSSHHGLAVITAPAGARTVEGLGLGATPAQVAAMYPDYLFPDLGTPDYQATTFGDLQVPVRGNPVAMYAFFFDGKNTVDRLLFVMRDQDHECAYATS